MKILKSITFTLLASTLAYSQTTMCFKENHNSMTTIENTALDGGECKGSQTVSNMKTNGWNVDDIKITTKDGSYNFIYIFKKNQTQSNFAQANTNVSDAQLEERILKRMEAKKVQEAKEKDIEKKLVNKTAGKEIYIAKCQSCHGEKGEKAAYNVGKPLNNISLEDISYSINRYTHDSDYGYGYNMVMRTIAASTTKADIVKIKDYLDSINK